MRAVPVVTHHSDADEGAATHRHRDEQRQPVRGQQYIWYKEIKPVIYIPYRLATRSYLGDF